MSRSPDVLEAIAVPAFSSSPRPAPVQPEAGAGCGAGCGAEYGAEYEAAFTALYRGHYVAVCGVIDRCVKSPQVAEELAQDLFLAIWAQRAQHPLLPSAAYLYAERALIERRRAEHRTDPASAVGWDTVRTELLSDQDADDRQNLSSRPR